MGDGVGEAVSATHPDELEITYSLSGADASLFAVDEETGQIMVRDGVELALGTTYYVNLTATDSAGFGAIVIVMIEVTEAAFSPYDLNGNDAIERGEVIMAIRDYFDGDITKGDVIELIKLYFAGVTAPTGVLPRRDFFNPRACAHLLPLDGVGGTPVPGRSIGTTSRGGVFGDASTY